MELTDLMERGLDGFSVRELTEVFKTNEDGRKTSSIGFFRDEAVAKAFAGTQSDSSFHETQKAFVLTDGQVGILLGEPVTILSDNKAALEIKEKALAKLSKEERKILGF